MSNSRQWISHVRRSGLPLGVALVMVVAVTIHASAKNNRVRSHEITITKHYDKSSPKLFSSTPKSHAPASGSAARHKMYKSQAAKKSKTKKGVEKVKVKGIRGELSDAKHKDE